MTPERWQEIKQVFELADSMAPEERDAVLDGLCAGDADLRREVEELLAASGWTGTFIYKAIGTQAASLQESCFGPYRLVRRIGQGGMGAVFEANRVDDFHKKVALKVIKQEFDSDFARTRFQQERQLLAALEHPYIARLLDGGESEDGSPYLVLEFVDGIRIDDYCRDLDRTARLRLFLKVCEAVEYAHHNLVIHRDLKPANILVTAKGEPKLLDFGIAKLLDPDSSRTQTAFVALTPDYASPEQVRGGAISTASDVYSLGVVLYQLLTDRAPYKLNTTSPFEMSAVICEQAPAPPALGGELDNMLLMALRKEPERRYGSVEKFSEDVERYLDNRPVSAQPDTTWYRTRKYVRRHWGSLAAAAITMTAICGGAGVAVYQAHIAQQRFGQVRRLAHSFVFDYHDDLAKIAGTTSVREKMVRTALEYLDSLSQNAGGDLELQKELAAAYRKVGDAQGFPARANLGHPEQALVSYRKAAAIHERVAAAEPKYRAELAEFYSAYTSLLLNTGDTGGAARTGNQALAAGEQLARERPQDEGGQIGYARAWCMLGDIADDANHPSGAFAKYRQCDTLARAALERWHDVRTLQMAEMARARFGSMAPSQGYPEQALKAFDEDEKLLDELTALEPANPAFRSGYVRLDNYRATAYFDEKDPSMNDAARSVFYARRSLGRARSVAAQDTKDAAAELTLAISLYRVAAPMRLVNAAEAVALARESVKRFDEQLAAGRNGFTMRSRRSRAVWRLAMALLAAHRSEEALAQARDAVAEERKLAASDPAELQEGARLALSLVTYGQASDEMSDGAGAEESLREAERVAGKVYERNPRELIAMTPLVTAREALGEHFRRTGDDAQARKWFGDAVSLWRGFPEQNEYVRRKLRETSRRVDTASGTLM